MNFARSACSASVTVPAGSASTSMACCVPMGVTTPSTRCATETAYRPGTTYGPLGPKPPPPSPAPSPPGARGRASVIAARRRSHATRWKPLPTGPVIVRMGAPVESLIVMITVGASASASAFSSSLDG
jgi:hypothetical protein